MIQRAQTHCIGGSNDPRYPLFFVLGFALILWMVLERRGDVLHRLAARKRAREMPSSTSNVADELSRVARDIERDTNFERGVRGDMPSRRSEI
jgi:hypothetical protein